MKKIKNFTLLLLLLMGLSQKIRADYPLVSHKYLADPASLVYNGRVYLYCSNDDENPADDKGSYLMKSIACVSSSDLKNWTDHGIVFEVPRDAKWAGKSWAPSVVDRDGLFFLYFGNGGNGIGVATSKSPLGPFKDPIDKMLISNNTPGVQPATNMWLFDPMAFVDDDGQAYLYFGGNGADNVRVIKLNRDMVSVSPPAIAINAKNFFEASWMHKNNGIYYFSYSTNPQNGMRIDYLQSTSPTSGFTYGGTVSPQPPLNNNNNHQAIFKFNGEWYEAYHNRAVAIRANIPPIHKRNLCLDKISHNADGSIETMVNTEDGLKQLHYLNPFERVEAETMNAQYGIKTEICSTGGLNVCDIEDGDWIKVKGVDFKKGSKVFTANIAGIQNAVIEIHLDSIGGKLIGKCKTPSTGSLQNWKTIQCKITKVKGVQDVVFVFTGGEGKRMNFNWWSFKGK